MNEQVSDRAPSPAQPTYSPWLAALGGGIILALCAAVYDGAQTGILHREVAAAQQDNADLRAKLVQSNAELQNAMASVRSDMEETRQEVTTGAAKAGLAVTRHADLLARQQAAQARRLSEELVQVKQNTDQATARLDSIGTDVDSVKTDVGSVKTDVGSVRTDVDTANTNIEATKTDLQRMRGDLGMMSGLVATNGKEIQVLRDLGDRNIYEFTLKKSDGAQKVGDIQVILRKSDPRHNRYTVEVLADDKRVEKKDRGMNEPVQFYTAEARQPDELVVNQVKKDEVIGYLATPKVTISRNNPDDAGAK